MQAKQFSINRTGIEQIKIFLQANHKHCATDPDHFTRGMLQAWAADAEFQLAEGNPPTIEIRASESVNGRTQEFTISDDGVCTTIIEIE